MKLGDFLFVTINTDLGTTSGTIETRLYPHTLSILLPFFTNAPMGIPYIVNSWTHNIKTITMYFKSEEDKLKAMITL